MCYCLCLPTRCCVYICGEERRGTVVGKQAERESTAGKLDRHTPTCCPPPQASFAGLLQRDAIFGQVDKGKNTKSFPLHSATSRWKVWCDKETKW